MDNPANASLINNDLLDTILIQQKDRIISLIDRATSLEDCGAIAQILLTLQTLWTACDYEYKLKELKERLLTKVHKLTNTLERNL